MHLSCELKAQLKQRNMKEYGENYQHLDWVTQSGSEKASLLRGEILARLDSEVRFGYKNTKLDCTSLSPGCGICGDGTWSCLFINGICNCSCFYCPARQDDAGVPTTNTLPFVKPADYLDYIDRFGFKGVSISGGEPLLTPDLTLEYIEKIKKRFGEKIYTWMYTNGSLITEDIIRKLEQAGLDEIRFDICATGYRLEKARLAVGHFRHVTVEIPAIPEHYDLMRTKVREISDSGIHFLNLHQLRLTPYNFVNLSGRGYTYLHGEKVTVLESELAALNLIRYCIENNIGLPVNYCSFVYKNRFQKASSRRRSACMIRKPHEDITEAGYIRQICLKGETPDLENQVNQFIRHEFDERLWSMQSGQRLYCSGSLFSCIDLLRVHASVAYFETMLLPSHTYRNPFVEVSLNNERMIVVERKRVVPETELTLDEISLLKEIATGGTGTLPLCESTIMHEILRHECIPSGLQEYF